MVIERLGGPVGALILITGATAAGAADRLLSGDHLLSPAFHQCTGPSPGNAELGQCIELEVERQEGALNATYKMVMARLSPARRDALRVDERAWVRTRKRTCDAQYKAMEGGTGDGTAYDTCMATRAVVRTRWIERFR